MFGTAAPARRPEPDDAAYSADFQAANMNSPLRVVVTGKHGQLVRSILEVGAARGIEVAAVGRPELELTAPATIEPAVAALRPQVLVNAAGYTDTERAEDEPALAQAINVDGASAVAACARKLGVPLIHLSSAYVFDGSASVPYRETDPVNPLGAYGRTKALGETAVAAATSDLVILRTSLVFSPFGRNTLTNMLKRAERGGEMPVVADQQVNPTSAFDLAGGVLTVAANLARSPRNRDLLGTFHVAGRGAASPAEFAEALFAFSAPHGPSAKVIRIKSSAYVTKVRRPLNALLDCSRIAAVHGVALPSWETSLRDCAARFLAER
jgi:dTDP-4-dehydrorhamnose reductase